MTMSLVTNTTNYKSPPMPLFFCKYIFDNESNLATTCFALAKNLHLSFIIIYTACLSRSNNSFPRSKQLHV